MRKVLKIIAIVIGSFLLLILGLLIYLDSPWGQDFVRGRAVAYLHNKIKTEVRIGHLGYGFPKYIVLNDALFLDRSGDTLLAVHTLKVDLNMMKLFHKEVDVQQIVLNGVHSHIYRNAPDTVFNFTYIIDAFTGNSQSAQPKNAGGSPLAFNLDRVKLKDIHARFDDHTGGILYSVNLDQLDLKMEKMDIGDMFFHVKDLFVSGMQTVFDQDTSYLAPVPKDTAKSMMKIIADNVYLRQVNFKYNNNLNKFLFALQLGTLQLQLNEYNRDNNRVDVKKLAINNSDATLMIGKSTTPPAPVDTIVKIDRTEGWDVSANDIEFAGLNFKMDNENEPRQPSGLDYSHLDIHNLAMRLLDLTYADTIAGNLKHFEVTDKSGLDVRELTTVFKGNSTGFILKDLLLQTPNTTLQDHIEVHYPSLAAVSTRPESLQLKLNIENSVIGMRDAALFMPYLQKQELFRRYSNSQLRLDASVTGFLNDLDIEKLYAHGLGNTEISLRGRLKGLPEPKHINYDLYIAKFYSSRNDISAVVPPGTLPASVRIPDRFGAVGHLAGNLDDYDVNMVFASSDGGAYIKGRLLTSPGKGREEYDLAIKTMQLNAGRIMKQDSLFGEVTADFNLKGKSFDVKTMNAVADGNVSSAYIKGYRYHDVAFTGKVANQVADIDMISKDANLQVQLNGHADFSGKYTAAIADINIDSADFQALKLTNTEFRARGRIHADFPELNPDYPRGSLTWKQLVVVAEGKRYFMDSVYAISRPSADTGQNIFVYLGVMDAHITGKTPLTKIGPIVQDHISRHYSSVVNDSLKINIAKIINKKGAKASDTIGQNNVYAAQKLKRDTTTIPANYDLAFVAHVYDKPMFHGLYPGLSSFDSIHIDGSLTPRYLTLNVNAPEIVYGAYTIENSNVQLRGSDSALNYQLTVDQLSWSNFALYYGNIHGKFDNNIITTDISLADAGKTERFALKGEIETKGDSQIIRLKPGLKLDYEVWNVTEPNRIVLSGRGFYVQNFEISNKGQLIRANNSVPRANTPLKVDINNFKLANITDIASKNDTLIANGVLNGNVTIEQMDPVIKVTGDMLVQNFTVYGDTVGNIHALVNNKTDDQLDAKITVQGQGNDISIAGLYYLKPAGSDAFNFNVDINALEARSFEGFTMKQLKNSSGYVRGNLKVQGTLSSPSITGDLKTDNFKTTVTALNADFKMPAEHIGFNGKQVNLNNITLLDNTGNKALINGSIDISDLTDPGLELALKADNWHPIHNTVKENKELYGDLYVTTNLSVSGSASMPSVDGNVYVLKGTKLTVSNPSKDPELQSTKGVVVFVNMRDSSRGKALMPRRAVAVKPKHKLKPGSDFNVNITVDKNAEFTLVIDEASGDFINVRGDAYLNTALTNSGEYYITGTYLLHSGVYQMNYNFIRRRFLIQDGSTVTFTGDPLKNADLDVTAVYQANTPAYDLVARQVPDPAQLVYFRQSLPFDINLHLKGNLVQPAFSFDVVLPENKVYPLSADQIELVQAKLSQIRLDTGELNKQVFAVLILGRFVSDDPFSASAAQGVGFSAIQSVSTFIGEELNRAANKLVKGVDLTVDLATNEDYTTGELRQRTDLNVAASKRILNDRLKLTVGNDFEVEGPQTNSNNQSDLLPSNLAADYLISGDGRYTMRVYRRNYDEGVLQGYVTETGINFIVSVDYNRFKYIFKRHPKKRQTTYANSDTGKVVKGPIR